MKQSLSGVWKAYVMQTMNGQSGTQERLDDGDDIDDDNENDNDHDDNNFLTGVWKLKYLWGPLAFWIYRL